MWLTFRSGPERGRVVPVTGERFVVGRTEDCDLMLDDEKISRQHCAFVPLPDGKAFLEDLGSTNGTWVNGNRITAPVLLEGNEQVQVGDLRLVTARAEPRASSTVSRSTIPELTVTEEQPQVTGDPRAATSAFQAQSSTGERRALRRDVRAATALSLLSVVVAALVAIALAVVYIREEQPTTRLADIPATSGGLEVSDIVERATPSTVLVVNKLRGERQASGTGWVLDAAQGLIVTNFHVVNGGDAIEIGVGGQMRAATVIGGAPCEDLAVVQVTDATGLVTLPLGSQAELRQGDRVVALGYPISGTVDDVLIVTEGIVSAVSTRFDVPAVDVPNFPNVIQTDAAINPGNSGGPLVDLRGRLVGVNSARQSRSGNIDIENQGFAIGVDRVREVVPTLTAGRSLGWTGSSILLPGIDADPRSLGLPPQPGFIIDTALPGSPAEQAGFGRDPALVTAIDGRPIGRGGIPAYCEVMNGRGQGDTAVFTATFRGGRQEDVRVGFL